MDYKGGQILYGHVLWHPEQNLNAAYKLQLEKVNLCTGRDGYVPFLDPTGTVYNEGPRYGCIQPNKYLKHRFLLLLSEFHSVSSMPGVDGFTLKVDALYKALMRKLFKNTLFVFLKELMPSQRQDTSRGGPCSRGAPLEHPRWSCPGAPRRRRAAAAAPSGTFIHRGTRRPLPGPGQESEAGAHGSQSPRQFARRHGSFMEHTHWEKLFINCKIKIIQN
ncbi:uncharacterized protein LOC131576713 [Poecile atricapillus]|uniref:uncharacterized protein LOC131576713 n=1 Tax=Poecile atricapillus TaxID=48891 RepID=UPI002738A6C2|nr:uncharacterized protein LOC131576713 [Poecile atricapillus]